LSRVSALIFRRSAITESKPHASRRPYPRHREAIITNWQDFARTVDPEGQVTDLALRDHASEILAAIAIDMEMPQSDRQPNLKGKGMGGANYMDAVSVVHAKLRIGLGFRIDQIIAEYGPSARACCGFGRKRSAPIWESRTR
jgi:hypothetical protein